MPPPRSPPGRPPNTIQPETLDGLLRHFLVTGRQRRSSAGSEALDLAQQFGDAVQPALGADVDEIERLCVDHVAGGLIEPTTWH